jgi:hypothetical protein
LEILDESEDQKCLVIEVPNDRRSFLPLQISHRAKPAFARNELEAISFSPDGNWLKETAGSDRRFQLSQLHWIELATWLEWISTNASDRDALQLRRYC